MKRTKTIWTAIKEGHMGIIPAKFGQNPARCLDVVFKEIVDRHRTNDRLPTITIAHLEPMAQVQVS